MHNIVKNRRVRIALSIAGTLIVACLLTAWVYRSNIQRLFFVSSLFSGREQYDRFNRIADLFPHSTMTASPKPYVWPDGEPIDLPEQYSWKGQDVRVADFLAETDTSAVLVLQDGKLRFEEYWLTGGVTTNWLSMSVAKSFVSAAIGIAVGEELIDGVDDPITKYVPELNGSAYEDVPIRDILQMSSGAGWDENYDDPASDINRMGRIFALGGSMDEFVPTLERAREPGTYNRYNSMDTQALGMLLVRATGQSITSYMQTKLWHPLGMESPAYWIIDDNGMELAFGGLNATARDYAKIGELYRLEGDWQGAQIVPASWIRQSLTADRPHLVSGKNPNSENTFGYGYQWWLPEGDDNEFLASGVYGQYIYVHPGSRIVIVKLSAFSDYATSQDESSYRKHESIQFFRSIVAELN